MEEKVLLQSNCSLYRVTTKGELDSFCCGDDDLDDFFQRGYEASAAEGFRESVWVLRRRSHTDLTDGSGHEVHYGYFS